MPDRAVFGYGSLVNTGTHDHAPCLPAILSGWRRAWRRTPDRKVAFLTVLPDPHTTIEGLVCGVDASAWDALDDREFAYRRHSVAPEIPTKEAAPREVVLYAIDPERLSLPDDAHPILLSYLDVVVTGYLRWFGQAGVDRFAKSTCGWEAPILDDRAAPLYPRALPLTADERRATDALLRSVGGRVLSP